MNQEFEVELGGQATLRVGANVSDVQPAVADAHMTNVPTLTDSGKWIGRLHKHSEIFGFWVVTDSRHLWSNRRRRQQLTRHGAAVILP